MSAVGITSINFPTLKSVKGDDVIKFGVKYEKFNRKVLYFNRGRPVAQQTTTTGIKRCISAELLISLVLIDTFLDFSSVDQVTEEHVQLWISERSKCFTDDMALHVTNAINKVKFRPDRSDPHGATLQLFADIARKFRRNRVEHAIKEAPKALISQIVDKLELSVVRETIRSAMHYWPREKKYHFNYFMKQITDAAVQAAKHVKRAEKSDDDRKGKFSRKKNPDPFLEKRSPTLGSTTKGNPKSTEQVKKREWKVP